MRLTLWLLMALGLIAVALLVCIGELAWLQRQSATRLQTGRDELVTKIKSYNVDRAV